MPGLFDRFVLAIAQGSIAMRSVAVESLSEPIGDSFILDWSLDDSATNRTAEDDAAIGLTTSAK